MHHDITLKEVGIFKIWDIGGWERRTHMPLEVQNKKWDLVLKSSELIFVWNSLISNIWMDEVPFRGLWTACISEVPFRGVWAACASLWTTSCFLGPRAVLPWPLEFIGKILKKWRHEFEYMLWLRQSIQFLQSWITYVFFSWHWFITETCTTSFSASSWQSHWVT